MATAPGEYHREVASAPSKSCPAVADGEVGGEAGEFRNVQALVDTGIDDNIGIFQIPLR
jgi:hypothetical protein